MDMPMPMQMADGGVVQHFQDGTGEEGAFPSTDTSSDNNWQNLTPEQIKSSREYVRTYLAQEPSQTPSLQQKMAEYVPIYKTLLGSDKDATKAQVLFDISQRALNYAANVNDKGQAMRGSQAARLAGAFSSLPAAVGARVNAMAEEDRALNMAALQAGQKDIDSIRTANSKLLTEQMRMQLGMAKGKTGSDNPFGTSLEGREMNIFRQGAADYGAGLTTPDQDHIFEAAVANYTAPIVSTYLDPTGRQITETRSKPLPEFMVRTLAARKSLGEISRSDASPGLNALTSDSESIGADAQGNPITQAMLNGITSNAVPSTPPTATTSAAPMAPPDVLAPNFNPSTFNYNVRENAQNIFNAGSGTGPMAYVSDKVGSLPLIGNWAMQGLDQASANNRTYIRNTANSITAALQNSPTYAQQERKQIEEFVKILPQILDNRPQFEQRAIQLDIVLEQKMLAAQAELNNINKKPREELTRADADMLNQAQATLSMLNSVRMQLGAPIRIYDENDPRLSSAAPGTRFTFNGQTLSIPYPKNP